LLAGLLSFGLYYLYVRYGASLSNRRLFARTFIPITMTTMLIITVVKSSLALSLGLVGALSIVRFRAAIKEPEELAYLFLCIAVGLGLGADQRLITILAFVLIGAVLIARGVAQRGEPGENLYLTVTSENPNKISLEQVIEVLQQHCSSVNLKRFDEKEKILEATFVVRFEDLGQLKAGKDALRALGESVEISFLDNRSAT
jgi:hypothetical protein